MYPGLSDTDCWIAELNYRHLVDEGLREQRIATARTEAPGMRATVTSTVIAGRRQLGAFLVRAGHRIQGVQAVTRTSFDAAPAGDPGAIA
jgi:hypothetical protein